MPDSSGRWCEATCRITRRRKRRVHVRCGLPGPVSLSRSKARNPQNEAPPRSPASLAECAYPCGEALAELLGDAVVDVKSGWRVQHIANVGMRILATIAPSTAWSRSASPSTKKGALPKSMDELEPGRSFPQQIGALFDRSATTACAPAQGKVHDQALAAAAPTLRWCTGHKPQRCRCA